jgi:hypothetical protein
MQYYNTSTKGPFSLSYLGGVAGKPVFMHIAVSILGAKWKDDGCGSLVEGRARH